MNNFHKFLTPLFICLATSICAQQHSINGLWGVCKVEVGTANMTPVAKWFRINPDGSIQAGNGWLQNSSGTWQYNSKTNIFSTVDSVGITDKFGGFQLTLSGDTMFWERLEGDDLVRVTLLPIQTLPKAPADHLQGLWDLIEVKQNDSSSVSTLDTMHMHRLFIRWDRLYINFSSVGERHFGYWHVHGHRSELTLIPMRESQNKAQWTFEVNTHNLIMTGISESNKDIQYTFRRSHTL